METFKGIVGAVLGILGAVLQALKSKRVWVILVMFLINGVSGISDQIPVDTLHILNPILTLLGVWFGVPTVTKK